MENQLEITDENIKDVFIKSLNRIRPVSVGELLTEKGEFFYIPLYQRGYRWSESQVIDLCNDLLEYALKENKLPDDFYSIQPLIVKKTQKEIDEKETECYEVIDGQQRLTTLFLLYRYLLKKDRYTSTLDAKEMKKKELYHIFYETRPNDFTILEKIGFKPLKGKDIKDIDMAHCHNALYYMDKWLYGDGFHSAKEIFELHSTQIFDYEKVVKKLTALIENTSKSKGEEGDVEFIWYELAPGKDAIKEFIKENKGKILLTDTEKIKALFLQRKNFQGENKNQRQDSMSKDWDMIENTLQQPDFWAFISNDREKEEGRIGFIFNLIYENDENSREYDIDDYLFRYYYDMIENRRHGTPDIIGEKWKEVTDYFRILKNWYNHPLIYNLIGLLVKSEKVIGSKDNKSVIKRVMDLFNRDEVVTTEDFIEGLNKMVKTDIVDRVPLSKEKKPEWNIPEGEEYINLAYGSKNLELLRAIFRFINVVIYNRRIWKVIEETGIEDEDKKQSDIHRSPRDIMSSVYKFPFDVLDTYGWDVEHIDSATTNSLKKYEEQKVWIEESEEALPDLIKDPDYIELKESFKAASEEDRPEIASQIVTYIQGFLEEADEALKDWIGNLTLLDCGTNRGYGNSIFPLKQFKVRERESNGIYVPAATHNVFEKTYDGCSKGKLIWNEEDKKAYHKYLLKEIKDFKTLHGDSPAEKVSQAKIQRKNEKLAATYFQRDT